MNPYPWHVAAVDVDFVARAGEIDVEEIRGLSRHREQVFGFKSKGRSHHRVTVGWNRLCWIRYFETVSSFLCYSSHSAHYEIVLSRQTVTRRLARVTM